LKQLVTSHAQCSRLHLLHVCQNICECSSFASRPSWKLLIYSVRMLISQVHPVLLSLYLSLVAAPVVLHDGVVLWNEAVVSCFAWGRLRGTTSEQLVARPRFEPVSYRNTIEKRCD
jgi:hypothetical protein